MTHLVAVATLDTFHFAWLRALARLVALLITVAAALALGAVAGLVAHCVHGQYRAREIAGGWDKTLTLLAVLALNVQRLLTVSGLVAALTTVLAGELVNTGGGACGR